MKLIVKKGNYYEIESKNPKHPLIIIRVDSILPTSGRYNIYKGICVWPQDRSGNQGLFSEVSTWLKSCKELDRDSCIVLYEGIGDGLKTT